MKGASAVKAGYKVGPFQSYKLFCTLHLRMSMRLTHTQMPNFAQNLQPTQKQTVQSTTLLGYNIILPHKTVVTSF